MWPWSAVSCAAAPFFWVRQSCSFLVICKTISVAPRWAGGGANGVLSQNMQSLSAILGSLNKEVKVALASFHNMKKHRCKLSELREVQETRDFSCWMLQKRQAVSQFCSHHASIWCHLLLLILSLFVLLECLPIPMWVSGQLLAS